MFTESRNFDVVDETISWFTDMKDSLNKLAIGEILSKKELNSDKKDLEIIKDILSNKERFVNVYEFFKKIWVDIATVNNYFWWAIVFIGEINEAMSKYIKANNVSLLNIWSENWLNLVKNKTYLKWQTPYVDIITDIWKLIYILSMYDINPWTELNDTFFKVLEEKRKLLKNKIAIENSIQK